MDRDQLVTKLTRFLQKASPPDGDPLAVLDPTGQELAHQLAAAAEPTDVQAMYLIGWLHWQRYQTLPDGQDHDDLQTALSLFARLLPIDAELIPEPLRGVVATALPAGGGPPADADPAALSDAAAGMLRDPRTAADPGVLDQAVDWLRQAVAATAITHPDRAGRLSNLGIALQTRFERTGAVADLDEAVQAGRDAVAATPTDHPDRATMVSNLGAALQTRYGPTRALADLDEAVQVGRDALAATQTDHPGRAGHLSNLGNALRIRHERTGGVADLDEAVQLGRDAVAAIPTDHPARAGFLSNLGGALQTRFAVTGAVADLDEAVRAGRDAVAAAPIDHPNRARYLSNLGGALRRRFAVTGAVTDLDEAVRAGRDAVAATPTDHPDRAGRLSNLSGALQTRFGRTGAVTDLDEAARAGRDAVAATPTDHPDRAGRLSNLSKALHTRFGRTGAVTDLDEAAQAGRDAVAATPVDHPDRASHLHNLSAALHTRFDRTGAVTDLDEAAQAGRDAVAATPVDHPDRASHLHNLSAALRARYERNGALADLDEAAQAGRDAVAATPVDHPDRAAVLSNLGAALHARFDPIGTLVDLDEAVQAGRDAVAATPTGHQNLAKMLSNLGAALHTRYEETAAMADLDEAVQAGRDAVAATTTDDPNWAGMLSNLGNALRTRYERTGAMADLEEAVQAGRDGIATTPTDHPNRAVMLSNLGLALRARFDRTGAEPDRMAAAAAFREGTALVTAAPTVRVRCGRSWMGVAASAQRWDQARRALSGVLELLPLLVEPTLAVTDQQHRLQQLQGLGPDAARAAMGNLNRRWRWRHRAAWAWTMLEDGRGVLLRQALAARSDTTTVRAINPHLARQLDELRMQLAASTTARPADPGSDHLHNETARQAAEARTRRARDAYQQLEALLAHLRRQPGFTRFGLPPTIAELKAAATGGTIVALTVTGHGCGALILTRRRTDYLPLPRLSADAARERANTFLAAFDLSPGEPVDNGALNEVLAWMWDSTTGPILDHLGHTHTPERDWPRIWWIPTGALSVLPIHAAGHHTDPRDRRRRTVLDRIVSSYTPTAQLLAQSRIRATTRPPGARAGDALAVGINHTPNLPDLRFAETEARDVQHLLDPSTTPLLGDHATHNQVAARLAEARVSHFACHAMADHTDPSRSHLALRDGSLPVAELSQMQLPNAALAYLSACTTATGSVRLLDEQIHIASAFQLAGYPHVIATLWPINDYLALDIGRDVHTAIAAGTPAHLAMHHTIRALRDQPAFRDQPQHWASHIHFGP